MTADNSNLVIGLRRSVFNATMRDARKEKGLTLAGLSWLVFGTPNYGARLGTYETMRVMPPRDIAQEIADALEIPLQDIFPELLRKMPRPKPQEIRAPVRRLQEEIESSEILRLLNYAGPRGRAVLEARFGLGEYATPDNNGRTFRETGEIFGMVRQHAQHQAAKAMRTIRLREDWRLKKNRMLADQTTKREDARVRALNAVEWHKLGKHDNVRDASCPRCITAEKWEKRNDA